MDVEQLVFGSPCDLENWNGHEAPLGLDGRFMDFPQLRLTAHLSLQSNPGSNLMPG